MGKIFVDSDYLAASDYTRFVGNEEMAWFKRKQNWDIKPSWWEVNTECEYC